MFKMTRIEQNGSEKRQGFSLEEKVDFADQQTGNSELNMYDVCGCWRSRELSTSLLIYKDHSQYRIAILCINEYGEVIPEINALKEEILTLDEDDILRVWGLGEYEKMQTEHNSEIV